MSAEHSDGPRQAVVCDAGRLRIRSPVWQRAPTSALSCPVRWRFVGSAGEEPSMTTRPHHSAASIRHAVGTAEQSEPRRSGEAETWHISEVEEWSERAAALGEEFEADADQGFAHMPRLRPARLLVLVALGGVLAGLAVIAGLALMGGQPRGVSPETRRAAIASRGTAGGGAPRARQARRQSPAKVRRAGSRRRSSARRHLSARPAASTAMGAPVRSRKPAAGAAHGPVRLDSASSHVSAAPQAPLSATAVSAAPESAASVPAALPPTGRPPAPAPERAPAPCRCASTREEFGFER